MPYTKEGSVMGSHNGDNIDMMKVEETETSEPTVEIKIKTLDSQTYTLRVDKCVPVPTLKEQIATVTGILSEQQRLICRGRVLKDDQLLSAYHVEDGHTLHLVVREPVPPSESRNNHAGPDYPPGAADAQSASGGPRVVVGTFNISDQTQGGMPDINRILSAFMGSLGVPLGRSGDASESNQEPPTLVVHRMTTSGGSTDSIRRQPVSVSGGGQHTSQGPTPVAPREHLYPPVIPDSLTTLSQYLNQVTSEFAIVNGGEENAPFPGSPPFDDGFAPELSPVAFRRGMPTAGSLAEVLRSTRQLLINQTAESLSRLATQLHNQVNVTDASARMSIQSNAMRSGIIFRNLGALLLELGRTTMMLRMGETPADAVVNAGSAVFVNEHGPNPIMVQPFPMGSEFSSAGLGSSFFPSNVDFRIRTGNSNEGEQTGQQQSSEPVNQAATGIPPTASHRHAEVHIRPIRAVFGAVPVRAAQSPDPSRGANGIVFPVLARVQPTSANTTDIRSSALDGSVTGQPVAGNDRPASATQYFEEINTSLDEYLQNMFNTVNEQPPPQSTTSDTIDQPTLSAGASDRTPQTEPNTSEEGIFLSNILRQIMPYISQRSAIGSAAGPSSAGNDVEVNMDHGTASPRSSLRRQSDEPSSSEAKRQKRE